MLVHEESELELCADSVCSADKHGLFDALCVKLKESAEAADIRAYARGHCSCDMRLHQFDSLVACRNINACCGVAFGM